MGNSEVPSFPVMGMTGTGVEAAGWHALSKMAKRRLSEINKDLISMVTPFKSGKIDQKRLHYTEDD